MTDKTFSRLTKRQREVIGAIAIGQDGGHHPATLQALERKGLIERYTDTMYGPGSGIMDRLPVRVTRYHVPTSVHIAWCEWCSQS